MSILQPESSIWYGICWVVVVVRCFSKRMRLGSWRNLQIDDYLAVLALATLTILFALLQIIIKTNSNLIAPNDDISKWSPDNFRERVYGSKLTIIVEQMQILTIWILKACMLIMYARMTDLLRLHIVVKAAAVYVGLGFTLMEILWFGVWCRPFNQYYAVPANSPQCSAMINHLITNAVLNISSDVVIMIIPLPLVFKVQLPMKNKLILGAIFLVGFFTIFAAAKNKYESFTDPFATKWIIWYFREACTAMICANLPLTRPVLQRLYNFGNWTLPVSVGSRYGSDNRGNSRLSTYRLRGNMHTGNTTTVSGGKTKPLPSIPRSDSEEYIDSRSLPLEIMFETEVRIERHDRDGRDMDDLSIMEMGKGDQPEYPDAVNTKSHPGV